MECLEKLIGIRGCQGMEGKFYVNDLPGMTVELADAGANKETDNGIDLIKKSIAFASDYIANDIVNFIQDKFNQVVEQLQTGYYEGAFVPSVNRKSGINVRIKKDQFIKFTLNKVSIHLDDNIATQVFIYNLFNGELLKTIDITAVENSRVDIETDFSILSNGQDLSLFICTDSSIADHYRYTINSNGTSNCSGCSGSKYLINERSGYISGVQNVVNSNFVTHGDTGGLSIQYNIECCSDAYVCSIKNKLSWALLYKTGAVIMHEVINSKQYNTIIIIHSEDNKELVEYYESEYKKAMNQLTSNLKLPESICFECKPRLRAVIQLP